MSENQKRNVVIIGTGPAGYTAAIYTARANLSPLIIHGPLPGGQLTTTTEVENFPGFPEGIQGPDLMANMEAQAKRFGADFLVDTVTSVDCSSRPFKVTSKSGVVEAETVILATGASPKFIGIKAEQELMGYGVSTCATCDGAFYREKDIVVVGGGDSACEEANFLTRFGKVVYLIHRRDELRASKIMQERVFKNPKIKMIWNTQVKDIIGTKQAGVSELVLYNDKEKKESKLRCDGLFVAIGHTPNSHLVKGYVEMDENGYILPNPNSTSTKTKGLFVCGDVQDHKWRQAITAAGSGCMAALEAERFLEAEGH